MALDTNIISQSQTVQAIVNAITVPAYILNQRWDVVTWNRAAKELFTGWLDKQNPPRKTVDAKMMGFHPVYSGQFIPDSLFSRFIQPGG